VDVVACARGACANAVAEAHIAAATIRTREGVVMHQDSACHSDRRRGTRRVNEHTSAPVEYISAVEYISPRTRALGSGGYRAYTPRANGYWAPCVDVGSAPLSRGLRTNAASAERPRSRQATRVGQCSSPRRVAARPHAASACPNGARAKQAASSFQQVYTPDRCAPAHRGGVQTWRSVRRKARP
jgi:hypothetical protein